MPVVSVILPAYNAGRYIGPAVRSVLGQSLRDLELLVIDDGSTDDTGRVLNEMAANDGRLRVISRPNRGLVATLNEAIEKSTAPLIARMDADDVSLPDRLARQVAFMAEHPDVVLLGGGYWLTDGRGRRLTRITPPSDDTTLQAIALSGRTPICHPLAVFRRDAVLKACGYREEAMLAEDLDLWLRLGEIGKMACVGDTLLEYRQHSGSISESRQTEQQAKIREVLETAYRRRGIEHEVPAVAAWRAAGDSASGFRQLLKYGWWAFNSGYRRTAVSYGWQAVRQRPRSGAAWRLFVFSAVKPRRKTAPDAL